MQRAIYDGEVYSGNLSSDYVQSRSQDLDAKNQAQNFTAECVNAGAAVVLVPPKRPWTLSRVILGAKLSLLDKLSPVVEEATNMQVRLSRFSETPATQHIARTDIVAAPRTADESARRRIAVH